MEQVFAHHHASEPGRVRQLAVQPFRERTMPPILTTLG
jgi:hypothetical protein